jgi:hypothetical protein
MACYIFLKSLRSLAEFRKNPHVKIRPKSPSTNFQILGKFKNPILIQKFLFFLIFGPADPAARLASGPTSPPAAPSPQANIAWPAHPARVSVTSSREIRFAFRFTPSRAGRLSLISLSTGPHLSDVSSPPRRPTPAAFFRPLRHPAPPDLRPRDARQDNYPAP